ncbi:restriction endonuclease [Methylovirgula ligni]|uniref:Restriction system protein n=1 Tax=Methylovirgula ligni TaxID=569860 RepID=A0A3D9YXW0_9HYPH|nr:restriction endonuclease [Methylovirgula ligni]QAY95841.1 restriction endonuclease [Methylovirgula ligni]REF86521.1 restriction system protein [Methylovirgula ligni]
MPIPDYQTLMLPVLKLAARGETSVPEITGELVAQFGLTKEERDQVLPSGRQTVLHNRIHWAKFYMSKAGLITSPRRGRFIASEIGRDLIAKNPGQINVDLLLKNPAFKEFYRGSGGADSVNSMSPANASSAGLAATVTPEEQIEAAYLAVHSALQTDLLQRMLQNSPSFFEQVIVSLLVAMGYGGNYRDATRRLGRSGDGGVDGIINEDRLGLDRVYVQAKRYTPGNTVGRPEVQSFVGSLVGLGAAKGVFVTTSTFSQQASDYARNLPQRVILIDGKTLTSLMIEHKVGVRVSRALEFSRLDEDFFSEEE